MNQQFEDKLNRIGNVIVAHRPEREMQDEQSRKVLVDVDDFDDSLAETVEMHRAQRWRDKIPSRFSHARLADVAEREPQDVCAQLSEWAQCPRGRNLVLTGPLGAGKSHAAVAACRDAFFSGIDVQFLAVTTMLKLLQPGGDRELLWDLVNVPRLIIDDLGSEKESEWTVEQLYIIINERWLAESPTIVTTNIAITDMKEHIEGRLLSRLAGSGAVLVCMSGPDQRFES